MSTPSKRSPLKSLDVNCCTRVRRVVERLSMKGGLAPVFVADFHYPCAVYSALWILQQANPDADLSALTGLGRSEIAGFLGLGKNSAEDFSEAWERVLSFAEQNGLISSFPAVEIFVVEDLGLFLANPANIPRGGSFAAVFVEPRKPSYMSEERWRSSGGVGHWVAVGPERSLLTRPAFAAHARSGGIHGPYEKAVERRGRRMRQAGGARFLRQTEHQMEHEPPEGEPEGPTEETRLPSDEDDFLS